MIDRKIQVGLWALAGLLLAVAFGAIVWMFAAPLPTADPAEISAQLKLFEMGKPAIVSPSEKEAALSQLSPIWEIDARKPLLGQPLESQGQSTTFLSARLMAITIEPNRSYAIFADGQSQLQVRAIGQEIDGATVSQIEPRRVTLDRNGQSISLELADAL